MRHRTLRGDTPGFVACGRARIALEVTAVLYSTQRDGRWGSWRHAFEGRALLLESASDGAERHPIVRSPVHCIGFLLSFETDDGNLYATGGYVLDSKGRLALAWSHDARYSLRTSAVIRGGFIHG